MPYRSAAKVVSYVDAGASSSDDNLLPHGKSDDNTTGKGTGTESDHCDSDESEEDWNDSSSAAEEEESSSTASDHEGSSGDEGSVVETATEEDTDGDSDASDVEMCGGADETGNKKGSSNRKRKGTGGVTKGTKVKKPRVNGTAGGTRMSWNDDMVCRFLLNICIS